ncbi:conserved hypothetical protein [Heliomicrobium modesticaldum Ice1]|uniref:Glycosyltransferase RgtA/B/C/D-like domain-containing protein n=1 Tax=Heliobacterium modesticaldum (strain ATCC 51547 / Ice1) TaxID=498761 RepID=B0TFL5_HELMI|nr:glycosyltransferase family 39 protein [Heliomicrobium modesticaldum]ABZ83114.1 conserved hypothetical protein [Heliomicrobium modesticaldum Ice1]
MFNEENKPLQGLLLGILALAFVLRVTVISLQGSALFLNSDDAGYIRCAAKWLETGVMTFGSDRPTAFVGPLFPGFVAIIFAFFGSDDAGVQAVRYAQALLGLLSVFLTYRLVELLSERRTALLAAFFMAVYPSNILVNGLILTETLFTVLNLGYLFLLVKLSHGEQGSEKAEMFLFGLLGAYTALLTLTRATAALFPLVFMVYLLWRRRYAFRSWLRNGLIVLMVFALSMSPWWVRNYIAFDRFIPFSSGAGEPLLLGTYVDMEGLVNGSAPDWPVGMDELDTQQKYKEFAIERLKENVPKEPLRYLKWYTWGKFLLMWGGAFMWEPIWWSIRHLVDLIHQLLMVLALGGIAMALWRWWNRREELRAQGGLLRDEVPGDRWGAGGRLTGLLLLLSMPIYYTAVHNLYFGFPRYNIPFLPIIFFFSAYAVIESVDALLGVRKGDDGRSGPFR